MRAKLPIRAVPPRLNGTEMLATGDHSSPNDMHILDTWSRYTAAKSFVRILNVEFSKENQRYDHSLGGLFVGKIVAPACGEKPILLQSDRYTLHKLRPNLNLYFLSTSLYLDDYYVCSWWLRLLAHSLNVLQSGSTHGRVRR